MITQMKRENYTLSGLSLSVVAAALYKAVDLPSVYSLVVVGRNFCTSYITVIVCNSLL